IAADGALDSSTACPPGVAGAPCVLALYDRATAGCDPAAVATLKSELDARAHLGPLWADGRALFRTARPIHVAGEFNSWSTSALATAAICGGDVIAGVGTVPTGLWPYKLVDGATWSLDPDNPAFAYDDFADNPDGRNSVPDTPASSRGALR